MKIAKYEKKGTNQYKLTLENKEVITLYEDTILKEELLLKKEIENLETILKANEPYEAYYKALKYITRKQRSQKELRDYLKEYDSSIVENTITRLKKEGYLEDKSYIKAYVHDGAYLSKKGFFKIKEELEELGFKTPMILEALNEIDSSIWNTKLTKLIDKKMKSSLKGSAKATKQKVKEYCLQQGYLLEDIEPLINKYQLDDKESLIKEITKLKKKLSKKYEGKELEVQLLTRLLNKGYSYEAIKKNI